MQQHECLQLEIILLLKLQDYKIFMKSQRFFIGVKQSYCLSLNISFNANPMLISNANHKTLKFYWRNRPQISIIVAIKDQTLHILIVQKNDKMWNYVFVSMRDGNGSIMHHLSYAIFDYCVSHIIMLCSNSV